MTRKTKDPTSDKPNTKAPPDGVGYGRPPSAHRFKPGQSGNPRGRPRGSHNKLPALSEERLKSLILEEAYRNIKITEGSGQVSIPMAKAVMRSIAVNAAKGQPRAQKLFTDLLTQTEKANKALYDEATQTAIDYKIEWEEVLAARKRFYIEAPDPIPHPDDIHIDYSTGVVTLQGPMDKKQKEKWQNLRKRSKATQAEIKELKAMLADPNQKAIHPIIRTEIIRHEFNLQQIKDKIGDWDRK
jgi:hypothetical protein